ncbi:MAG: pyridoxamine 5'-phosphate oxidase family protein [Spirochaetales bacterium]|nr:pyridoxamine 5'-phosphate oxidase family protein [Spirochaetales bacterium]
MRRSDKEITDQAVLEEILKSSNVCRIAMFDKEYPYIVPMNYGYFNNAIYMHCAPEGKKLDLLKDNNRVSFEIEDSYELVKGDISCKWTSKFRSIVGFGKIEFITNPILKREALDILMEQHGKNDNYYKPKVLEWITILKLEIDSYTGKLSAK